MSERFSRTELLLGSEAMDTLGRARVAVFGVGGVGGYVCECLVRSGIGAIDLIDSDRVSLSNLNRQIIATEKTIGVLKVEAMKERIREINPGVTVRTYPCFFLPENAEVFPFEEYSYIVDAVDTVTAKIGLVMKAREAGVPVISSMGAGNKLDPSAFRVADIFSTRVCPLARVMRRELKKRGVKELKVVYSEEEPVKAGKAGHSLTDSPVLKQDSGERERRSTPGSVAFVPSVAGMIIGGEVIRDLIGIKR